MSKGRQWWDEFWAGQTSKPRTVEGSDETWHDLVWKVALEFWHDLFEKLAPGREMLECGCGSARVSRYMAQHGYQCTLLDYSEKALHLGRSAFEALSLEGRFVIGDIDHLCFPAEHFDIVFSGGVLEFFSDVQGPINEMVRVLKRGGIFGANMVPNKFSVQTIADLERTLMYSCRNLVRGRFGEVFKRVKYVPSSYNVNSMNLQDYIDFCERAQLAPVVGLVTSPFPELALPQVGKRLYARIMKRLLPQWQRFNLSKHRWTEIWGAAYTVYGIKK
jgi:ubiquinone/menaquinone biosynthesis C-methylase UbiE